MKLKLCLSLLFVASIVGLFSLFSYLMQSPPALAPLAPLSTTEWHAIASKVDRVYRGGVQYKLRCYKCHGLQGEGTYKGVPLNDTVWLHGDGYQDIYSVLYHGAGAMKGYGKKLLLTDLQDITVYLKAHVSPAQQ